ncbi:MULTISPECIES: STAS domain-containing protein [unclassified Streptomyces]|uniref:STAS domain-containing protein n=1 Tax=unclassified Streptomyces TaxID=2593676 RepID=UPI0033CAFA25
MSLLTVRQTTPEGTAFLMLALVGELEVVNVDKLTDAAVRAIADGQRHLLLDLTGITRCDTGSLYTLLGIRHAANHAGGSLAVTEASASVHEALLRTGLRELLPVTPG